MCFRSRSPSETRALARALCAALLRDERGEVEQVVVLEGPLGAGKTVFAQGVAEGLGIDPALVASPTFVIAQEFEGAPERGGRRLVHVDLYRLEEAEELEAAGWRDWLAPGSLVLVEWGERFPEALPRDRLEVVLAPGEEDPEGERSLRVRATGPRAQALRAAWREEAKRSMRGATCP